MFTWLKVRRLSKQLSSKDRNLRYEAAESLGTLGDARAVMPLILALSDSDHSVRCRAAEALGRLRDARAVKPLIRAIGDDDFLVRFCACTALCDLGEPKWREIDSLESRCTRIKRLGDSGDARAAESVIRELEQNDDRYDHCVFTIAVEALVELGALEPLIRALGDSKARNEVTEALKCLGEPKWKVLLDGDCEDFARLAVSGDVRDVEVLVEALAQGIRPAAEAMVQLGDRRAVEPLIRALSDRCDDREAVVNALGHLGGARVIDPLIAALRNWHPSVRIRAAEALTRLLTGPSAPEERLDGARIIDPLIAALQDDSPPVRRSAAKALARLLTGPSAPEIGLSCWRHICELITTHDDSSSHFDEPRSGCRDHTDSTTHADNGIGLDFPPEPPAARSPQTDF